MIVQSTAKFATLEGSNRSFKTVREITITTSDIRVNFQNITTLLTLRCHC